MDRCKSCGRKNPAGFSFCGHCGVSMSTLDAEQDPFDAMLEEVIASMEPSGAIPVPAKPVRPTPRPAAPKLEAVAKPKIEAKAETTPPRAATKPATTKKLAAPTKPKKAAATPLKGFSRPAAPPVSGQHAATGKAAAKQRRRGGTAPSLEQAARAAQRRLTATPMAVVPLVAATVKPARTGHTTVVQALQPARPYAPNHSPTGDHSPNRIPTSKLKAMPRAAATVEPAPAAETVVPATESSAPKQRPRRRRSPAFGAGVLARYNKR
jgi:hypothetical protein